MPKARTVEREPLATTPMERKRKALGLSLPALASLTGVNIGTLSRYERGMQEPRKSRRLLLAGALGITEDMILNPEKYPPPKRARHNRRATDKQRLAA